MKTLALTKGNLQQSFDSFELGQYKVDCILKPHPSIVIVIFHTSEKFDKTYDVYDLEDFFEEEIQYYGAYNFHIDSDEHDNHFLTLIF